MELPVFNAPEGFKNIFDMNDQELANYHGISLELANSLSTHLVYSMIENNIAIEREEMLEATLTPEEFANYLETGEY